MVTHTDSSFLQIFLGEGFLCWLITMEFLAMVTEEVTETGGSKKKTTGTHKPRAWRWKNTKPLADKCLIKTLTMRPKFSRSYAYTLALCSVEDIRVLENNLSLACKIRGKSLVEYKNTKI